MNIDPLGELRHRIPVDVLRLQADSIGDNDFLVEGDDYLSYAEVDEISDRYAAGFAELGVDAGACVAMFMDNSADMVTVAFGINRLGAVWSPLSTEYRGEWLGELLADTQSRILVVDSHHLPEIARLGDIPLDHVVVRGDPGDLSIAGVRIHRLADFRSLDRTELRPKLYHGDTNAVLWTSGTTGRSKGVMQSHAVWTLWAQRHNEVFRGGIKPGERFYYCMPMYNSGGWVMNIFPALVSGSAACIDKRFSVTDFWQRIRHYRANHTMTLGTMHVYLFGLPALPDDIDNPLRSLVMNPVIPQIMKPFMERFGIERVSSGFGQSEIMGATLYTSDLTLKPGSCGYTVDDDLVETKLLDDHDGEVAIGEIGEFCVRPRVPFSVFNGYLHRPEETALASRNFWHHSGDLGRRDEDGEMFFVDRKKDSLRHKGRNTSTFEVEHIARQFPGVANAAAVGVAVAELESEEELMIALLPRPGESIDPLEFCKFMDDKAPYFFVPRYVQVTEEFPMTPTGKIQKFVIRERGITSDTWDRELMAADWRATRPAVATSPVAAGAPATSVGGGS